MQRIKFVSPPQSYVKLRSEGADFSQLSSDTAIRRALWEQQSRRCAYCERRLKDPSKPDHRTRIEHFHPQSSDLWDGDCEEASGTVKQDKAPTSWKNLLLCCDGNERAGASYCCDKSKAGREICAVFRNPKSWPLPALVNVDRAGYATVALGLPHTADAVIKETLNLNADHLVSARKAVLAARIQQIEQQRRKHRGLTHAMRIEIIGRLRKDAESAEFGAVLLSIADRL
ncbi:hypothetical protein NVV95_03010 [Herbiconiux sp. CPCC 205716]|uniref:TIGR02646 family protein n=1 Tax=Herbiconiux gentiana TaxID=2970912 RepID=A0ABT2GE04_9MICO|nr:hypothetical protein [Herbiconiux gentiana]MCS5713520.1 hypothetical protein [Herbiconiux gentiana]